MARVETNEDWDGEALEDRRSRPPRSHSTEKEWLRFRKDFSKKLHRLEHRLDRAFALGAASERMVGENALRLRVEELRGRLHEQDANLAERPESEAHWRELHAAALRAWESAVREVRALLGGEGEAWSEGPEPKGPPDIRPPRFGPKR